MSYFYEVTFMQAYWLWFLPLPWVWLGRWIYRGKESRVVFPRLFSAVNIRYPLLNDTLGDKAELKRSFDKPANHNLIFCLSISLLIFALAEPVKYKEKIIVAKKSEPIDMIFIVSTAISMRLVDYKIEDQAVNRMTFVRHVLGKFFSINKASKTNNYHESDNKFGLVVLGSPPALWLPLTSDNSLIKDAISRLRAILAGRISDMGASFKLVINSFSHTHTKNSSNKAVILVSDGSTQLGQLSPISTASELLQSGFTLYVIAIGSTAAEIKYKNKHEQTTSPSGLVYEPTDLNMLSALADSGGGKLYHALDSKTFNLALKNIELKQQQQQQQQSISKASHSVTNSNDFIDQSHRRVEVLYPLPLALAMLLLLYVFVFPNAGKNL